MKHPQDKSPDRPAINCAGLTRRFGDVTAVSGLDLEVHEGELFGLVGPDGSGKTTVMRLLTAVLTPSAGDAWVAGFHIVRDDEALKDVIGYMSQRFGLYPDLTVEENIRFYADIYGVARSELSARMDRLLGFSHLTPFRKRLAGNLSGGMKQKLGLACALIHTPEVIFLDEPTNGVDPVSRRDFWGLLAELIEEGVTVFASTAYLDEAEQCHRVALLHDGAILACAPPDEIRDRMTGGIVEVFSQNSRAALKILRRDLPQCRASLFGGRVHLIGPSQEQTAAMARDALARAGLEVRGIKRIDPSLEDVFVTELEHLETPKEGP